MITSRLLAVLAYVVILFLIVFLSFHRRPTSSDFIIGGRSMNFWLTALAAHASDMSSWLLMAFPSVIFTKGPFHIWIAIGLLLGMFFNWQLIAPRVRTLTERYNAMTFSSFFESRFNDTTGKIRIFTAMMQFLFYTIYVSAGLTGLGLVVHTLLGIPYAIGISVGILIVIPYLFIGGYMTLAWTDLFQGMFLLCVVIFVPLYVMGHLLGGWSTVHDAVIAKHFSFSLFPQGNKWESAKQIFYVTTGWGLGYFGLPHIVTKFMGIKSVSLVRKAQTVGMTWMALALGFATLIALVGIAYFPNGLENSELVFVDMVSAVFPPFLSGLILCAIFGVTITAMGAQILVLISSLAEDIYKRMLHKEASSKQILLVSRAGIFFVAVIAYGIAHARLESIQSLVSYAWYGLGASFGPLLFFSLYSKKANKYGAWAGVLVGGGLSALWPYIDQFLETGAPPIIPGFTMGCLAIWLVSYLTRDHEKTIHSSN